MSSRVKAISGRLTEHRLVRRVHRWWRQRDFGLNTFSAWFFLLILTSWAILDFSQVVSNKDHAHQETMLRSQLTEFMISTQDRDGSSLLESPSEFTAAARPVRIITMRRQFFKFLLTARNMRSFQTAAIEFNAPRGCVVEYPVTAPPQTVAQQNVVQACFAVVPDDPAGRYVSFALRFPSHPVQRHASGQSLDLVDHVAITFQGERPLVLNLAYEAPALGRHRSKTALKRYEGFHEMAGFLRADGGRTTRGVQAQAYERLQSNGTTVVTILGRIDANLLPGGAGSQGRPSNELRRLTIGMTVVPGKDAQARGIAPFGFAAGEVGKSVMSLQQAYASSVLSRGTITVRTNVDSANPVTVWSSSSLDSERASAPPGFIEALSNHIAGWMARRADSVVVSQVQYLEGLPMMTATLAAEGAVFPDIVGRALFWFICLIGLLLFVGVAAVRMNMALATLVKTSYDVAIHRREMPAMDRARARTQMGTLSRVVRLLHQRAKREQEIHRRHLEHEDRRRKQEVAREQDLLKIRHDNLLVIGHEIKAPLASLLAAKDITEPQKRHLEKMKRIVAAMYEANRLEEGLLKSMAPLSNLDIAGFAADFVTNQKANGVPIEGDVPAQPVMAYADGITLDQVMEELVLNAWRYVTPGTAIEVTVRGREGEVEIDIFNQGRPLKDTVGIFTLGVTDQADEGHLGLGLYAAALRMHAMNGTIEAENRDNGVAFKIRVSTELS